MKWKVWTSSLFLIVISVLFSLASFKIGIGKSREPGPGFLPLLTSLVLLLLSIIVLIKDLYVSDYDKGEKNPFSPDHLRKPTGLIIILIGYILLLKFLGFLITTFLLIFMMLFVFDPNPKKIWKFIVIGVIAANLSFIVFYKWLQVQLPMGFFQIGY